MHILSGLAQTMRPRQWSKNIVVFVPFVFTLNQAWQPFSQEMWRLLGLSLIAFVIFCVLSGTVYLINDVADIEKDRLHPTKRNRPLPSGRLPRNVALIAAGVLLVVALGAALWLR